MSSYTHQLDLRRAELMTVEQLEANVLRYENSQTGNQKWHDICVAELAKRTEGQRNP